MQKIVEYIHTFIQSISNAFNMIWGAMASVVNICKSCVSYVTDVLSILPSWLYAILAVLITVCVIYKILGREGDG